MRSRWLVSSAAWILVSVTVIPETSFAQIARGPKFGSVPSGAIVHTDSFSLAAGAYQGRQGVVPHPETPLLPAPPDVMPPLGPEGSNYREDRIGSLPSLVNGRPVLQRNFPGIPDPGNVIPPDPIMAVGPNHVIACVNTPRFRIWDKNGTILRTINADSWFFSVHTNPDAFDPQIVYDHFAGRWVMVWDNVAASTAYFLISVSDDSDPIGVWFNWATPATHLGDSATPYWGDYPQLGYDDSAIYLTSRQFHLTNNSYAYNKVRIFGKAQLYANTGGQLSWADLWDLRDPVSTSVRPDGVMPSIIFGTSRRYFLVNDSPFRPGTYFTIRTIMNPVSNPVMTAVNVPVVAYSTAPNASQRGGGTLSVEAGGSRVRSRAVYRDSSLWAVHSVASGTGNAYSSVHYIRFNPFIGTNLEDAAMGLEGYWHFYPAIMVDQDKDVMVTFSRSSVDEYIGAFLSGRKFADPTGLSQSVVLKEGEANYVEDFGSGRNRWGDYMGIGLDPSDGDAIWSFTEYAASPANTWGTWVGMAKVGPLPGALIEMRPLSIAFGRVEVGNRGDTVVISITNNGVDTLVISSISQPDSQFVLLNRPAVPLRIPTFETVEIYTTFVPRAQASLTDSLVFTSNDTTQPTVAIPLTGRGVVIGQAQLGIMYAASGLPNSQLYTINTLTGAAAPIGPLGILELHGLSIRRSNKELLGSVAGLSSTDLYRVSVSGGDAMLFKTIPLGNMRAIASGSGDTLYGGTTAGRLYRINITTGDTTFIGLAPGVSYSGLSFSPATGVLWASVRGVLGRDRIFTVNIFTGDTALVGRTGDNQDTPSLTFSATGSLFGLKGIGTAANTLISIDTASGGGTIIGSTGAQGLQAITMRVDSVPVLSVRELAGMGLPTRFMLDQNFPNPFNPLTRIVYALPVRSNVILTIYNVLGQEVRRLVDQQQNTGFYVAEWNGKNAYGTSVGSGLYFYRLEARGVDDRVFSDVKKMLIVK